MFEYSRVFVYCKVSEKLLEMIFCFQSMLQLLETEVRDLEGKRPNLYTQRRPTDSNFLKESDIFLVVPHFCTNPLTGTYQSSPKCGIRAEKSRLVSFGFILNIFIGKVRSHNPLMSPFSPPTFLKEVLRLQGESNAHFPSKNQSFQSTQERK